jgi:cytoskeleton protein RodZ
MMYHGDGGAGRAMETLGAMLRRARLAQGLDLADMAERIKVNPRYLEALESDDLSSLPGGFFYKSFVRQYAAALGVDNSRVEEVLSALPITETEFIPPPREDASILKEIRPVAARAVSVPGLLIFNGIGPSIGVLILVMLACGGFSAWWHRIQTTPLLSSSPREVSRLLPPDPEPTATPTSTETPSPTPSVTPTVTPTPTPAVTAIPATTPVPAEPPAGGVRIVITAAQDSWLRVWTDGKETWSGMLKAQESKTFDGTESARLRTGNATGLTVTWNGKPIELPGADAFVRDVTFTHDSFVRTIKLAAPAPPPDAAPPTG